MHGCPVLLLADVIPPVLLLVAELDVDADVDPELVLVTVELVSPPIPVEW